MNLAKTFRSLIFVVVSSALLSACSTVPETGRHQFMVVSSDQAHEMSLSEFEKLKKETPISRDAQENALVTRVGQRIAAVSKLEKASWEFVVFDKPDVQNAFALPGGKVGVFNGLLKVTQSEAGLATVIGHEVAHATARHGEERMSQGVAGGLAAQIAGARSEIAGQLFQAAYGVGVMLPYSRKQELEADYIGLLFMARAGYDPRESVAFWKRFAEANQARGGKPKEFLSTHPLDETRIKQLEERMPQALAEYEKAKKQ